MTRRYRSALVAALACTSLLAATVCFTSDAEAARGRGKGSHAVSGKAAGKTAKSAGRKAAARSKEKKSTSAKNAVPQIPLVPAPTAETLDPDIALVKSAIENVRRGATSKATEIEAGISDPVARTLVEWLILRSDHNGVGSRRYLSFIAANPSWPSLAAFRRRAEAMLWNEKPNPTQVLRFFAEAPPQTGAGRMVLARALIVQGDVEAARAQIREAWRNSSMTADFEKHVIEYYSEFLTRADHKARMERRLFAADHEAALRMARRLGGADLAIAQARIAFNRKAGNAKKLLDAVPTDARQDPGYLFARVYALRQDNKIAEAAQVLLSAPNELGQIHDPEDWWVERRILSRKLLDLGDARSAYLVVRDACDPTKENSRVERHFMSGWIALRFLDDPVAAAAHFARIQDVSRHPTSLARSHYWLGRVAEATQHPDQARAEYEAAARSSAAYYGQLARARLGLSALALSPPPATPEQREGVERLELVRALEILYALNERSLVIPLMADLGAKLDDAGALGALGELAEQRQDARGMLHMGKAALARGLPLEYYAFPTVGVPRYSPIAPEIGNAMLFAVIRQESAFDPADLSAANAMGLMQVTPEAARDTCRRYSCKYDVKRLKNDLPYNLQVGAAEIAGLMADYRGNLILSFAGYNAGRGRVQEWMAKFGDPRDPKVDPIDWVERIPFMETRNYVQRVMENFQVYRTRFGTNAPLTIESDLRRGARAN
jgi:soluble lytic murein transglycosylase